MNFDETWWVDGKWAEEDLFCCWTLAAVRALPSSFFLNKFLHFLLHFHDVFLYRDGGGLQGALHKQAADREDYKRCEIRKRAKKARSHRELHTQIHGLHNVCFVTLHSDIYAPVLPLVSRL